MLGKDVLRYSLMVLLEKLNARERAVFILREAFNYDYAEIAAALEISEANARQLLSRAKKQLHHHPPATVRQQDQAFLQRYLEVIHQGDTSRLEKLLHEDITSISDGGGKVAAAIQPIHGRKAVQAFLLGIYQKFYHAADIRAVTINHQPALLYYFNGQLTTCQVFTVDDNGISGVYLIRNPEKLAAIAL
ncbi:sigma factor-like helix-turn-helix DNA-binding protein [Chitinophaga lutea]|uniref:sigma factor-like helix-turn-helix DNA-binding protein n=1 Tax=Chitinophaga lutea TaxID=2488634 RepID=UPI001C7063FC|nr:sigma factor-like helix-turn-helix DNA-binding protein [Chitinophaga lutea]